MNPNGWRDIPKTFRGVFFFSFSKNFFRQKIVTFDFEVVSHQPLRFKGWFILPKCRSVCRLTGLKLFFEKSEKKFFGVWGYPYMGTQKVKFVILKDFLKILSIAIITRKRSFANNFKIFFWCAIVEIIFFGWAVTTRFGLGGSKFFFPTYFLKISATIIAKGLKIFRALN
jgi:hypothetical protein